MKNKKTHRLIGGKGHLLSLVLCLLPSLGAFAGEPVIPYRARLVDADGRPLTSATNVTFSIYGAAGSLRTIWTRTYALKPDTNGVICVDIGDDPPTNALSRALQRVNGGSLTLGVRVGDGEEIQPRHELPPTVYAEIVGTADTASADFAVPGALTVSGFRSLGTLEYLTNQDFKVGSTTVAGYQIKAAKIISQGDSGVYSPCVIVTNGDLRAAGGANVSGNLSTAASLQARDIAVKGRLFVAGQDVSLPIGMVLPWFGGSTIPQGWEICDGKAPTTPGAVFTKSKPNLVDRFPVGAGSGAYPHGAMGGDNSVVLKLEHIPRHNHTINELTWMGFKGSDNSWHNALTDKDHNTAKDVTVTVTSDAAGGSAGHENQPPYAALVYIIKVK